MNQKQKQKQAVALVLAGVGFIFISAIGYEYRAKQVEVSTQSSLNKYVPSDLAGGGGGKKGGKKSWSSKPWSGDWGDDGFDDGFEFMSMSPDSTAPVVGAKSAKNGGRLDELEKLEKASRPQKDVLPSSIETPCGYDDRFHWSHWGQCRDDTGKAYDRVWIYSSSLDGGENNTLESCKGFCDSFAGRGYRGLSYYKFDRCYCHYDTDTDPGCPEGGPETCRVSESYDGGSGSVGGVSKTGTVYNCYPYESCEDL